MGAHGTKQTTSHVLNTQISGGQPGHTSRTVTMGLHQMPGNRAYWENDTRCPMVADNMSRNRFQTLLACLHFTDNNDLSNRQAGAMVTVTWF